MPGNFKREDLRIVKTHKALSGAIRALLVRRNFEKITVSDLCQEALVSKTAFYAHFKDKYDLLEYLLNEIRSEVVKNPCCYEEIEISVNHFLSQNTKAITNLIENANGEVLDLLHGFMYSIVEAAIKNNCDELNQNQIKLSNFCAGGMVDMLKIQVRNNFPSDDKMVNKYTYNMLASLLIWDANRQ